MPGVKSKLVISGILVPLLTSALLIQYFGWRTGFFGVETFLVWLSIGLLSALVTLLTIHSISHQQDIKSSQHESQESTDSKISSVSEVSSLFQQVNKHDASHRTILEMAPSGIIVFSDDGIIKSFNPTAEQLFSCRSHDVRGKNLNDFIPGIISNNGPSIDFEGEHIVDGVDNSGNQISIAVHLSEIHLEGKRMFTCIVADVSERKAAEILLQNAESRFRELVETAHDLVWSLDAKGKFTYLNSATKTIYGYKPEEMLGHHISEYLAPEHKKQGIKVLKDLLAGREMVHIETVHIDRYGSKHYLSFNGKAYLDDNGNVIHISGTARDVTEQKAYEQQLYYQAQHDSLTGLYNRNFFNKELERLVAQVSRGGADCAVFYLDLDQFKFINDALGHASGDRLLIECAAMFASQLREGDLLSRFGGDEFTLLLYNIDTDSALHVAEKLRSTIEAYRFVEKGDAYTIGCSIGVATIDNAVHSAEELMSHADLACNLAKSQGRNRVVLYDPALKGEDNIARDIGWAARVKEAVENDSFTMAYQPIVSLTSGEVHGYEALLRMVGNDGSEILPGGFLPAAERFGMIHNVERWSVRHAIEYLAQENKCREVPIRFSINLSACAFEDKELLFMIKNTIRETNVDPSLLTFEITEIAAVKNMSAVTQFIYQLKEIGCQFSLDDFGSGFSSFTYLKQLPVDKLKIDGAFVQGLSGNAVDHALVRSITDLAHALGKQTIASSVEDEQTLSLLKDYGVDYAQGFYLGRPGRDLMGSRLH
jgi:diguanylate cyclase (GGDEF)-like protein/PAS domain S-box-containing protein